MSTPSMICLCGLHVHPSAFIIGSICLVVNVLVGGYCTLLHSYILLIISLLAFISCLCLIIGNHMENPLLYWPWFILMVFIFKIYDLIKSLLFINELQIIFN